MRELDHQKYRYKYTMLWRFGTKVHMWSVVGRHGAVHLHLENYRNDDWTGGVEYHYREPPDYMNDRPPSHSNCDLLNSNCWHDGSSTYATEHYLPMFKAGNIDHDYFFWGITRDYVDRFIGSDDLYRAADWIEYKEGEDEKGASRTGNDLSD